MWVGAEYGHSRTSWLVFWLLTSEFCLAMVIGRVIGDIVATQKAPSHEGRKILVVQPLNLDGSNRGDEVLALDAVDAGVGDRVLVATEGWCAMTAVGRQNAPIDMAVVGVIDSVTLAH
ncbi:MAG TPA: EutN/CcmL family microcompartment protein [Terriglobia bacterium]|nr:EutN/CcmL family microcompartment protein [Terriglobia bacterium]